MILCVFILDYVVVIRLITRGGESNRGKPGRRPSERLCWECSAFQPGVWREEHWIWILMKASWACVFVLSDNEPGGSGAQAFGARFVSCKNNFFCSPLHPSLSPLMKRRAEGFVADSRFVSPSDWRWLFCACWRKVPREVPDGNVWFEQIFPSQVHF